MTAAASSQAANPRARHAKHAGLSQHIQFVLYYEKHHPARKDFRVTRRLFALALLSLGLLLPAFPAAAAELIMFRRAGCPYCAAWDRSIGPIYPRTELSRRAPLRLLDLDHDAPAGVALKTPVRFTPTFVLVSDGREIGRIEGYAGEDFFWALLERLMLKLPATVSGTAPASAL